MVEPAGERRYLAPLGFSGSIRAVAPQPNGEFKDDELVSAYVLVDVFAIN